MSIKEPEELFKNKHSTANSPAYLFLGTPSLLLGDGLLLLLSVCLVYRHRKMKNKYQGTHPRVPVCLLTGSEELSPTEGIENPAFDGGEGSVETLASSPRLGSDIRGDRPRGTLAAHPKNAELQASAVEGGNASAFVSLKPI